MGGRRAYIIHAKFCKLRFTGRIFKLLLALKICIYLRSELIKTKVMDKGHQYFLSLIIISFVHKIAILKKRNPFHASKCFKMMFYPSAGKRFL